MKFVFTLVIILLYSFGFGQEDNSIVLIEESVGVPGFILLRDTKKEIIAKYGRSEKFLYTKYRKNASTHPYNKRSAKTVIIQKIGRPKNVYYINSLGFYVFFYKDKSIRKITFKTSKFKTSKGLSVGDSREKAYQLYKEGNSPLLKIPEQGIDILFDCDLVKEIWIYKAYRN